MPQLRRKQRLPLSVCPSGLRESSIQKDNQVSRIPAPGDLFFSKGDNREKSVLEAGGVNTVGFRM